MNGGEADVVTKAAKGGGSKSRRRQEETSVLVVGAGPTGLTLAISLVLAGIDVIVIDAAASPSEHSKAAVVHGRTLEVLDQLGATEHLLSRGAIEVPRLEFHDRSHVLMDVDFSKLDVPWPCTMMAPQSMTEAALAERFSDLGGTIRRGHSLVSMTGALSASEAVEARVAVQGANDSYVVRARFLIGCDGSHSLVRHSLGLRFEGSTYRQAYVLADAVLESRLPKDAVHLFSSPEGFLVIAPLRKTSHRVIVSMDSPPDNVDPDVINTLLLQRGPRDGSTSVREVHWAAPFRVHKRVVSRFKVGHVMLCGDAAHIHSTIGGQGMNMGIQDAAHLGWRLAVVLHGNGSVSLLDEWATERRSVAQGVLKFTHQLTRAATLQNRAARIARNASMRIAGGIPLVEAQLAARLAGILVPAPPRYPAAAKA